MYKKYWSETKFADWIRGSEKPESLPMGGWRKWEREQKQKNPIRYWIAEEFLDYVQKIVMFPKNVIGDIKYHFLNRFVTKTHALTSTQLKKYKWSDLSDRILYCVFDEFKNFVEIEVAGMNAMSMYDDERKKQKVPFYAFGFFKTRTWRSPEAGIAYLKWEMSLVYDEDMGISKNDPRYGTPCPQAEIGKEKLELYLWWTKIRPNRRCEDEDIFKTFDENKYYTSGNINPDPNLKEAAYLERQLAVKSSTKTEAEYEQEDQEMLQRLIKIRSHLWT